jgi:hypothetical protein
MYISDTGGDDVDQDDQFDADDTMATGDPGDTDEMF